MKLSLLALSVLAGLSSQLVQCHAAPAKPAPVKAVPFVDPLANLSFLARWQTENHAVKPNAAKQYTPLGLYKDVACTQPATAAGDIVMAVRDESKKDGLVLTQGETTRCPTLQFPDGHPVLRFDGVDDFYLLKTSVPLAKMDIWVRYKINMAPNNPYPATISGNVEGNNDFVSPNGFMYLVQDYTRSTAQNIMQVAHYHNEEGASRIAVEGVSISDNKYFDGTVEQLCVGGRLVPGPTAFLSMDMDALLIGNGIPATDYSTIEKALGAKLDAPRLVCVGDSITDGSAGGDGIYATQEYPSQLQLLRPERFVINAGQWGARYSSVPPVDQLFSKDAQLVVFLGTNNIATPETADEAYNELVAYCQARRATGYKVFVATLLPRRSGEGTGVAEDFEAKRQAFNAKVRANYTSFADGLIDFAADKRMGDAGDEQDTTYYSKDQVHLSVGGAAVLAELVNAALPKP